MSRQAKTDRLTVRLPHDWMVSIEKAAEESGWDVSDQVRFELMHLRGLWKGPCLPTQPAGHGKDS